MGMDRARPPHRREGPRDPHARGDGPYLYGGQPDLVWRSPRAWGWTGTEVLDEFGEEEIPTRVGMDRSDTAGRPVGHEDPHARGDGPLAAVMSTSAS